MIVISVLAAGATATESVSTDVAGVAVEFDKSACSSADCLYSKKELKKDWAVPSGLPPWYKTSKDHSYITASPRSDAIHPSKRALRVLYPKGEVISASGDGWKVGLPPAKEQWSSYQVILTIYACT